ncbi:uncharacterized protein [Parasteatoda tepidariorum]|uniref:uncharacterized protein n=1 Tax=Parasteatoda tepidariorum TaxID=114398 RepID=UPI001C7202DE|nr:uncharacterized protein LOC107447409 [Parasteatoda tepidariorum]
MSQYRNNPNPAKELLVTHVKGEGPILKIWGLTPNSIELVKNFEYFFLTHKEELDCTSGFMRTDQLSNGLHYAVRSKIKNQWCRAVVLSPLGPSNVLVRLIDYGPEEQISVADVRQLENPICRYEGQASECILADVEPSDHIQWSREAIKRCENELMLNTMSLLIISNFQNIPIVRIAKKGESEPFVQRLINDDLAVIKNANPANYNMNTSNYNSNTANYNTNTANYNMNTLNPSTSHLVKISCIENAQKFYVQLSAAELELNKLMEEIQIFASRPENLRPLITPQLNQPCLSSHKQRYYRCRIVSFNQSGCHVSFVDYGFTEIKAFQDLKMMNPRFLQLYAQAICCTMPKKFDIAKDDFWRVLNQYPSLECEILAHTGEAYVVLLKYHGKDVFLPFMQKSVLFSSLPFTYNKLVCNERCEVNIGYINDISEFFCQLVQSKQELDAISSRLSFGNDLRPISLQECLPKSPVCAKFSEDNEWYRAEIVKVNHERDIEVFFVDFGNFDNATLKDLRKITEELLSYPVQAYKCNLADIDLPTESSQKDKMLDYFEELTAGQSFQAFVKDIKDNHMGKNYSVVLQDKSSSTSVNDKIRNKFSNLAVIPIAEVEILYITSFTSLDSFFGQFEKLSSSKLEEMQEEINEFYSEAQNTTFKPKTGDKVCAKYEADNQYYRARVEACSGSECKVVFLDYGNRELISVKDIHPMNKQFFKYPLFGVECGFNSYPEATPISKVRDLMLENSIQANMIEEKNNKWLISLSEDFSPNVHVLEILRQHEKVVPRSFQGAGSSNDKAKKDIDCSYSQANDQRGNMNSPLVSSDSKTENRCSPDREVPKQLTLINIPPKAYRNVYVSHVVSPSEFYCQIEEESAKLQQLMLDIETEYSQIKEDELTLNQMKIGSVCCAVFQEDCAWYRGSIKGINSGCCDIYFVDYGNTDSVPVSKIKALTSKFFTLPVQALKCKLFNAEPDSSTWSADAIQDFINLTLEKSFVSQFVEVDNTNTYAVNLVSLNKLEEDVLNKQFVNRGHGKLQDESKLLVLNSHAASSNLTFKTPDIKPGSFERVAVCFGLTPQVVFCQLKSYEGEFKRMMEQLQHHYSKLSPSDAIVDRPHVGMICVAQFHQDSVWYRGRITKMDKTGISVIYVDYGNTEIVEKKKVRCIAQDFTGLPIQAIKCQIKGIRAPEKSWSSKNNISKFFEGDSECEFVSREHDHYVVNLTVDRKNVAELLIKSGLAVGEAIKSVESVQAKQPDALPVIEAIKSVDSVQAKQPGALPVIEHDEQLAKRDSFSSGQLLSVAVSYVKSPCQFWCQSLDDSDVLDQLMADIQTHVEQGVTPVNLKKLIPGYYCLAKYSEDESWYRAQIVACISEKELEVFFIDYGNSEIISPDAIAVLPQVFYETYGLCFCCQLLGSSSSICTADVSEAFQNIVDEAGQDMTAKIDQVLKEAYVITLLYEVNDVEKNVSEILFPVQLDVSPCPVLETANFLPPDVPLGLQEGYVSVVNSPHDFFIQLASCEDKLTGLSTELSEICEVLGDGQYVVESPTIGLACAVKYSEDENWYRAEIINLDDSTVDVLFVDYGNVSTVLKKDLKVLDENFLTSPPYAIRCKLNGIVPCKGDQWSETVINTFQESVLDAVLGITFICKDIPAVVNLSKEDKDIGQVLVDLELANVDTCAETDEAYTDDHLAAPIEDTLHSIPIDQSYPKRKLTSTKLPVKICYVDSYTRFYVTPLELSTELDTVMKTLEILYTQCADKLESSPTCLEEPKAFLPCAAQYSEDEAWYRALITEIDGDNIYVTFVDYGNSEVSSLKSLKTLTPELLKIPPIAMECSLYAIQAIEGKDQDLLAKLEEYFVDEVVLEMEVYKPEEPYKVRLYHSGSDIAELFCEDGLAKEVIPPPEVDLSSNFTDDLKKSLLDAADKKQDAEFQVREMPQVEELTVNVKHCEVVNEKIVLFAVPVDSEENLANFQEKLQDAYSENQPSLENTCVSNCCVAKYAEDDNWYRAKILNCDEEGIKVQFVDYGNIETVNSDDLREILPDFLSEPVYSTKFCPLGLVVVKPDEVREKLDGSLYDNPVNLRLCKYCQSPNSLCFTSLICESEDLLENFLNENSLSQIFIFNNSLGRKFDGVIESFIGNIFYILPTDLFKEREELLTQLMKHFKDVSTSLDEVKPSLLYAAKIEDKWNRVSIISLSKTDSLVLCVDYGVNSTVELSNLALLPLEFHHKPLLLHPCTIKDYEDMPLECREIILEGIENGKTFKFEIDNDYSNDLMLEVKIVAENSINVPESDKDQKCKNPDDTADDSISTNHGPNDPEISETLLLKTKSESEEISPSEENEEHMCKMLGEVGVSDVMASCVDDAKYLEAHDDNESSKIARDVSNNEEILYCPQPPESVFMGGKKEISTDIYDGTNCEILDYGNGKEYSESDQRDEASKNDQYDYSEHAFEGQEKISKKTNSNFDECEDDARSDISPDSTELQDSECERARELSDVESEIKTSNKQGNERKETFPEIEISNLSNEDLDLNLDGRNNSLQEPESSCLEHCNETEDSSQEPESSCFELSTETEDISQEPESSCLEHLNEAEDISQEPESSCLEHLNEAQNFSQEPESSCLVDAEDFSRKPESSCSENLNDAENFSQEPESSCLEHLNEAQNFSREPESSCLVNAENFSQEPESSCSDNLNDAENLSQEPESSCLEYLNETEDISQEPESSCLEHLNEAQNLSREPESSCLVNAGDFSQEPESSCSDNLNDAENLSQEPESSCLEYLNETEDISQEPESSCLEHLNDAQNFSQEPESSYLVGNEDFSPVPESLCSENLNYTENFSQEPESSCLEHLNEVKNISQEPESARLEDVKSTPKVEAESLSEIIPETSIKIQNDGNVVEENDWDERPECDIKQELLAHGKCSVPANVAAECEGHGDHNLPLKEGSITDNSSENQSDVVSDLESNLSETVNNHDPQNFTINEQNTVRQLSELAGEACAQQSKLTDPPYRLSDGNVFVSHITVSGGSIVFPAIPKGLLPKLCLFKGSLQQTYSLEMPIPDSVSVSDLYAVFYEGEWYRGKVLGTKQKLVTLLFIDNGLCPNIEMTAVRYLNEEHKAVPPFALWCVLASAFCLPHNEQILQVFLDAMLKDASNTKQDIAVRVIQEGEPYKVSLLIEGNELLNVLLSEKQIIQQLDSALIPPGEHLAKVSCLNSAGSLEMHVNLVSELEKLKDLNSSMQLTYNTDNPKSPIIESAVYAVQHRGVWRRGQAVTSPTGMHIHLVDSGEKTDIEDVYPLLPEHCILPPCSIPCELGTDAIVAKCDPSDVLEMLNEKEFKVQVEASTAKLADEQFLIHLKEILASLPAKH